jgi:phage repressor protein C with HTH and peptisase S24 domain
MTDFNNNKVNIRFRHVYNQLKDEGKIKSKSDIASKLGTYNHVVNSILKGKRNITLEQMNKLLEIYGINANFLFGESDQMYEGDGNSKHSFGDQSYEVRKNIILVPHLAMAGGAIGGQETDNKEEFQKFSIPGLEGELIAIEISGDSMLPNITNGDIVICEKVENGPLSSLKDNSVYVIVTDSVVAKRIQNIRQGHQIVGLRLISDNHIYPPYEVELEEIRAIYKVKHRITNYGIS